MSLRLCGIENKIKQKKIKKLIKIFLFKNTDPPLNGMRD